jgi:hypothetical protein
VHKLLIFPHGGMLFLFMRIRKKIICLALAILLFGAVNSSSAQTASSNTLGIKIVPAIIDDLVKPGEIISREMKVTNKSDKELTMYAYLMDFKSEDDYGKAKLITPGSESGNFISSWVKISGEGVKFSPGQEIGVPFSVEIPKDIGPGGYYGAIVFGTQAPRVKPGDEEKGAAIGVAQQSTCLLFLQVEGKADERAMIREFKADRGFYSTPFNVKLITKISNLGNVHVRPTGVIEIKNMFGKKVSSLAVNEDRHNILPASSRIFENFWSDTMGFGKYEASLALSYGTPADKGGEGRKTMIATEYFWILPLKIITALAISLLVLLLAATFFLRYYKRRAVRQAMERMGAKGGASQLGARRSVLGGYLSTFFTLLAVVFVVLIVLYIILF